MLVKPNYYSRYPPLGLLKLASYHRLKGDSVEYVEGNVKPRKKPDLVYVTSLFTYAWRPVHESVQFYKKLFPDTKVILGGIYASLMPEHAKLSGADEVYVGLFEPAEDLMPAYDLVPDWDGSIIFSSRGCIRNCPFCAVPRLEGGISHVKYSIKHLIYPGHTRVILWDNNILAAPNWRYIFDELHELGLTVDFNQGLDARLINDEVAEKLSKLKIPLIRLAYDQKGVYKFLKRAVETLSAYGFRRRDILVYTLYNYVTDDPEDFYQRVLDLLRLGVVCYPMRYEPLNSLKKNQYVSPNWTKEQLEMVAKARRVLGFSGVFPPYKALIEKFEKARNFEEAFSLRPPSRKRRKYYKKRKKTTSCSKSGGKQVPKWILSLPYYYKYYGSKTVRVER